MKKHFQSGFVVIELLVVAVIVLAIGGVGYYVWSSHRAQPTTTATTLPSYTSPPINTPAAPQISTTSDLNKAMQALNQTSVSSSNTDSSQLNTQTGGF